MRSPTAILLASAALIGGAGCRCVEITPEAVRSAPVDTAISEEALRRWREAIVIANEFLASPWRRTLPDGCYEGEFGRRFVTEAGSWPIEIRSTGWGDMVVATGSIAQEATFGFVVGRVGTGAPGESDAIDNSFFRHPEGRHYEPQELADLILHETTHDVYREGAVGFGPSIHYYLEAVFLFRNETNTAEDKPHATDEEFNYFWSARVARLENFGGFEEELRKRFEEHLRTGGPHCEHGPFDGVPEPPDPK